MRNPPALVHARVKTPAATVMCARSPAPFAAWVGEIDNDGASRPLCATASVRKRERGSVSGRCRPQILSIGGDRLGGSLG